MKHLFIVVPILISCGATSHAQSVQPWTFDKDAGRNRDLERLMADFFSGPKSSAKASNLFATPQQVDRKNLVAFGGKPQDGNIEKAGRLIADTPKNIREIEAAKRAEADRWKEWDQKKPK